jgi:hypothetical protein
MKGWLVSIAMAANQLINALTGGAADESVSSRAGHARGNGSRVGTAVCAILNTFDTRDAQSPKGDHCDIAIRNYYDQLEKEGLRGRHLQPDDEPGSGDLHMP